MACSEVESAASACRHAASDRCNTEGQVAMVAPTTMTPTGPQAMRGGNADIWAMNNEGYLMRMHKRLGKALFTPFSTGCPIPVDQADNTRTIITWQPGAPQRVITDGFQSLGKKRPEKNLGRTSMDWGDMVQVKSSRNSSYNSSSSHPHADTATTRHTSRTSTGQNHPIRAANFASHKSNWQAGTERSNNSTFDQQPQGNDYWVSIYIYISMSIWSIYI